MQLPTKEYLRNLAVNKGFAISKGVRLRNTIYKEFHMVVVENKLRMTPIKIGSVEETIKLINHEINN